MKFKFKFKFFNAVFNSFILTLLIIPASVNATIITWNTQGNATDVANGFLSLDELTTASSFTYVDVGNVGFDIKVSVSTTMVLSAGDLNYTRPGDSIMFEFFQTNSLTPHAVTGFASDWLDLDSGESMGPFTVTDASGTERVLDTSSPHFILGSSIRTTDRDSSNGVNPDGLVGSLAGNWDNNALSFITDFSSLSITKFSIDSTSGYIAPTNLTIQNDVNIVPTIEVPEPSTLAFFALGLIGIASRRFKKQS